jgi:hypothetical protein
VAQQAARLIQGALYFKSICACRRAPLIRSGPGVSWLRPLERLRPLSGSLSRPDLLELLPAPTAFAASRSAARSRRPSATQVPCPAPPPVFRRSRSGCPGARAAAMFVPPANLHGSPLPALRLTWVGATVPAAWREGHGAGGGRTGGAEGSAWRPIRKVIGAPERRLLRVGAPRACLPDRLPRPPMRS